MYSKHRSLKLFLAFFTLSAGLCAQQTSVVISGTVQTTQVPSAATPGQGSLSIIGFERSYIDTSGGGGGCVGRYCLPQDGGGDPVITYDAGTVSVTVGGHPDSTPYGQGDSAATVAGNLVNAINRDGAALVTATLSSSTIALKAKASGSGTNYYVSVTTTNQDGTLFPDGSFSGNPATLYLSGGANQGTTTVYDQGNVTVTAGGMSKTVNYGQGDTAETVARRAAQAFNTDCNSPVVAAVWAAGNSASLEFRLRSASAEFGYSLTATSATTQSGFATASFATSISTSPPTNQYTLVLPSGAAIGSTCERRAAWQALSPAQQTAVEQAFQSRIAPVVQQKWRDIQAQSAILGTYSDPQSTPIAHRLVNVTSKSISAPLLFTGGGAAVTGTPHAAESTTGSAIYSAFASPTSGPAPLTVNFSLQISDPTNCHFDSWDFGDGQTSTTPNVTHTYLNSGTVIATVWVHSAENWGSTGCWGGVVNTSQIGYEKITIAVGTPGPDSDGDGFSDAFETQLADTFTPVYFVSKGERAGTGFAFFLNSVPETASTVTGPTPPISYYRVTPQGIATINGIETGFLRVDYLTLWNRDDGLDTGFACDIDLGVALGLLGFDAGAIAEGLGGHTNDNEHTAFLIGAPTTAPGIFSTDPNAYGIFAVLLFAHEGTFFDHTQAAEFSPPVSAGVSHLNVYLSRQKHGSYHFNPDALPLMPSDVIAATYAAIDSAYSTQQISYSDYLLYEYLADTTFYCCLTEKFSDQGGTFAQNRINVGELQRIMNNAGFILDPTLEPKLQAQYFLVH